MVVVYGDAVIRFYGCAVSLYSVVRLFGCDVSGEFCFYGTHSNLTIVLHHNLPPNLMTV